LLSILTKDWFKAPRELKVIYECGITANAVSLTIQAETSLIATILVLKDILFSKTASNSEVGTALNYYRQGH